jgi:hypothetical protein
MELMMDVLTALAAIAFVIVLFSVADNLRGEDDGNDYNSERGVQEDQHPGRESDAVAHGQRTTCGGATGVTERTDGQHP